jgi:hypothetical protein
MCKDAQYELAFACLQKFKQSILNSIQITICIQNLLFFVGLGLINFYRVLEIEVLHFCQKYDFRKKKQNVGLLLYPA